MDSTDHYARRVTVRTDRLFRGEQVRVNPKRNMRWNIQWFWFRRRHLLGPSLSAAQTQPSSGHRDLHFHDLHHCKHKLHPGHLHGRPFSAAIRLLLRSLRIRQLFPLSPYQQHSQKGQPSLLRRNPSTVASTRSQHQPTNKLMAEVCLKRP